MNNKIETENMEWFVHTADTPESEIISLNMRKMNLDTETECLEIVSDFICSIFRIDAHLANLIITNPKLKNYQLYAKEKISKVAFPVGPVSAKFLLGLCLGKELALKPVTFDLLVENVERARYKHQGKKLFELTVLMENSAKKKGFRTFKIFDLIEKYKKGNLKPKDLIGADKVVYDYLCQKSYVLEVKRRNDKFELRAISWPKVHVAMKLRSLKIPE